MTKNFSDIIKEERALKNLTQQDLANELGVSKSTIAMWEIGKRLPSKELYEQLADFFNVDIDYLYRRTDVRKILHFSNNGEEYINADYLRKNEETVAQYLFDDDMKLLFDMRKTTQFDALMKYARYLKEQYDKENNL